MHLTTRLLKQRAHVPCAITVIRTLLMVPFVILLLSGNGSLYVCAMVIWILASLLDVADGHVARKLNAVTKAGAMMDLAADRIMIVVGAVMLISLRAANEYIILLIVVRELLTDSMRAWRVASGFVVPHNIFGRLKMTLIVIGTLCALAGFAGLAPRHSTRLAADGFLVLALLAGGASAICVWYGACPMEDGQGIRGVSAGAR